MGSVAGLCTGPVDPMLIQLCMNIPPQQVLRSRKARNEVLSILKFTRP